MGWAQQHCITVVYGVLFCDSASLVVGIIIIIIITGSFCLNLRENHTDIFDWVIMFTQTYLVQFMNPQNKMESSVIHC